MTDKKTAVDHRILVAVREDSNYAYVQHDACKKIMARGPVYEQEDILGQIDAHVFFCLKGRKK